MGSLKPGLVRLLTTVGVLKTVNYGVRHFTRPGCLGRIRSIHFARWVFVAGTERMIFCSNYDGSVESYMDDFINKTGFGLNASFSNGIGYPEPIGWCGMVVSTSGTTRNTSAVIPCQHKSGTRPIQA